MNEGYKSDPNPKGPNPKGPNPRDQTLRDRLVGFLALLHLLLNTKDLKNKKMNQKNFPTQNHHERA